ncbi:MAG: amidohydrolase family protein [Candidatus Brocadiia bacterium]
MSGAEAGQIGRCIDAYAHAGQPRFGSGEEAIGVFDRWGIEKGVLALGPGIPDLAALGRARDLAGERVRLIGIPFGETGDQRQKLAYVQLAMGIEGLRLMPFEVEPNAAILDRLGEAGLWLFAINIYDSVPVTEYMLDWLERHGEGRIAAPHFLKPCTIEEGAESPARFRELLAHPRFHAILSRHGGVGSRRPYPHEDLRPWVQEVAEIMTWDRLMWGSEFPVLYWRNEQVDEARRWILELGVELPEEDKDKFFYANAQRLFFAEPAPPAEAAEVPDWVEQQFNRDADVTLFRPRGLDVPMPQYARLLSAYLRANEQERALTFGEFIIRRAQEPD